MLRIELKATTESAARVARAALIKTLQEVSEEGLAPCVTVGTDGAWFVAEVSFK